MPLNNVILMTQGSWETTNLLNNEQEVAASRLFLHILCDSEKGGIKGGSGMEHYVCPVDDPDAVQPAEPTKYPLFPGRFEADLSVPTGSNNADGSPGYSRNLVVVENSDPTVSMGSTRVWLLSGTGGIVTDDDEVTDQLLELYLELDYPQNIARGYVRIYKRARPGEATGPAITIL
jgi:hypothetical protein